jgi:hypothetical protein
LCLTDDHIAILSANCDFNGDDMIDRCEVHDCVIRSENEWRTTDCPDYGMGYCECPFYV